MGVPEERDKNFISELRRLYLKYIFLDNQKVRGLTRPKLFLDKILEKRINSVEPEDMEKIDDKNWENLIILDGCRYDVYKVREPDSDYRISAGSQSTEYVKKNFSDGEFGDTVYISGNPHLTEDIFKQITEREREDVFFEVFDTISNRWSEENRTVMPEAVIKDVKTAEKLFPEKRKIIHFMQPHHPFIESDIVDKSDFEENEFAHEWDEARKGKVSNSEIKEAYEKNLDLVLGEVKNELLPELSGKTVITSDHGNLIGEQGMYSHPPYKDLEPLRKVPWHVVKR